MYLFSMLGGRCGFSSGVGWRRSSSLLLPQKMWCPSGIWREVGTPVIWKELKEGDNSKGWGEMLAIKGLECQEKEGWTRPSVLRSYVVPSLETCPQKRGVFLISHF